MDTIIRPERFRFDGDAALGDLIDALRPYAPLALVIEYDGRAIQAGYHVTEVKAGSFVTLDCGGNPDAWLETVLQVEDLPASAEQPGHMAVGKFLGIIAKVAARVPLNDTARLTFEVGPPAQPMQIFDVEALEVDGETARLRLQPRAAICKPRHRAQAQVAASCCGPSGCC